MRKMLLGIYLALLGCGALILFIVFGTWLWAVSAVMLYAVSAYFAIDGWFMSGPRSREEEGDEPKIPPRYK